MCTLSINKELNGIELIFESKPAQEILASIKAAGFRWHNLKKLWYAKQTPERMELAQKLSGESVTETTLTSAATEIVSKYGIKAGDILECTWGYSMTLVEFYKVTKILSPCKVEIVKLACKTVPGSEDRGGGRYLLPDTDAECGEPLQKMVSQSSWEKRDGQFHIKINDSIHLRPWDGGPCYFNNWD